MRKVSLPSGAELIVNEAPFADAKALFQAVASEMKGLQFDAKKELDTGFMKDLLCTAIASEKIEECLKKCLIRSTYNKEKITDAIFENNTDARKDYLTVCYEVAKENVYPFLEGPFAGFFQAFQNQAPSQK